MTKTDENESVNSIKGNEIRTATRTSLFQRLAARYGFVAVNTNIESAKGSGKTKSSNGLDSSFKVIKKPTEVQLSGKNSKEELELIERLVGDSSLTSTVQDLFEDWVEDTQNTYANIQERMERLNALTYMCDNEGIVKTAVTLVASETASLTDTCAFTVISEDKTWESEINYMLKNVWKYDQPTIYSLAWSIFLYGEAFQSREVSSAGIIGMNLVKSTEIAERLEFKPAEVANFRMQMQGGNGKNTSSGFTANLTTPTNGNFGSNNINFNFSSKQVTYCSTDDLLKNYIENIADISATEFYTSHLLGYRIFGDQLVAPWQISHYRFNAGVSEFWPYGQPSLLACLSAYKELQRIMGLDDLEKLLSMPIHTYKVKTGGVSTGRAFDLVHTVKERFENVGLVSSAAGLEGPSLCTNIWTSDDLVSVDTVETNKPNDSGSTDKMRFFSARLSTATGIPMSYIDPSAEGFQMSGVALTTLFKPFRTLIENIRGIIQAEVEDTIRLHDSIRGVDTPDFVMTMNVINPVATEDTNARLQLADSVMESVANLLGLETKEELPQAVKKDILLRYTGLTVSELENFIDVFKEEGATKADEVSDEEMSSGFGDDFSGDDMGSDEGGGDEDMEESIIRDMRKTKKKLIQERYRVASQGTDMKYYLVESLGSLQLANASYRFNESVREKCNADAIQFLKQRPKRNSKGKRRLHQ